MGSEIEVFAYVESSDLENFWLPTVQAPQALGLILPADTGPTQSSDPYVTNQASFSVSGLQDNNSIYYSLNGGSWQTAPVNQTTVALAAGNYTSIDVRQVDAAGNYSPLTEITSNSRSFVVDTTNPVFDPSGSSSSASVSSYTDLLKGTTINYRYDFDDNVGVPVIDSYNLSLSPSSHGDPGSISNVTIGGGGDELEFTFTAGGERIAGVDQTLTVDIVVKDLAGNSINFQDVIEFDYLSDNTAPYLGLSKSTLPAEQLESDGNAPQVELVVDFSGVGSGYVYNFDDLLADGTVDVAPKIKSFDITVEGRNGASTSGATFDVNANVDDDILWLNATAGNDLGSGWEDKITVTATVEDAVGNTLNFTDIIYWDYA